MLNRSGEEAMSMKTVGVIGAGYIGSVHIQTLMRIPGVQVKTVADTNKALLEQLAARLAIPIVTTDYRELLDDPDICAIHNCTPNSVHFAINKEILEAGKHILSEKPLSVTSAEAMTLRDLALARGVVNGINFCYRYYPVVQEAAVRIRRGDIGTVREIVGHYLQDWLLFDTDYSWRLDRAVAGASCTVADIGSHWFDLAQFLSGSRIVEVMADLETFVPVRKRPRGEVLTFAGSADIAYDNVPVELEDYGSVLLHFDNGARGATTVSQLCAGRKCTIDIQVYGSGAGIAWNHEQPSTIWTGQRDRSCEELRENPLLQDPSTSRFARLPSGHPMGYFDAVYNLFSDFYMNVDARMGKGGAEVAIPDFETGYYQMRIIEAAVASNAQKRWVTV
jgi:predicted dehydrogenase